VRVVIVCVSKSTRAVRRVCNLRLSRAPKKKIEEGCLQDTPLGPKLKTRWRRLRLAPPALRYSRSEHVSFLLSSASQPYGSPSGVGTCRYSRESCSGLEPVLLNAPASNAMPRWFEKSVIDSRGDESSDEVMVSIAQLRGLEKPSVSDVSSNVVSISIVFWANSIDAGRLKIGAVLGALL